jgi:hypothetical protein
MNFKRHTNKIDLFIVHIMNRTCHATFVIFSGKYYLVDSDYPNRTGYLTPYKESTYHLPEFHLR